VKMALSYSSCSTYLRKIPAPRVIFSRTQEFLSSVTGEPFVGEQTVHRRAPSA
jgi:hypothetical protein